MKTHLALVPAFALIAASLAGCDWKAQLELGDATPGADGKAQFSYTGLAGCLFGCSVSHAMMTGTLETIDVDGDALPARLTASIDDATVLTGDTLTEDLECCTQTTAGDGTVSGGCEAIQEGDACAGTLHRSYSIDVNAVAPGAATLTLHAADGSVFDTVLLHVANPASLAFSCTFDGAGATGETVQTGSVHLAAGQQCGFQVNAFDGAGDALQASEGFQITAADPNVAEAQPFFDLQLGPPDQPVNDSVGEIVGMASGSTTIVVQTNGITQAVPVAVQ
jgi:hypothetical protein